MIKTQNQNKIQGIFPLQDSPTMVMLQFKVIMRNPNKSKFSMIAERGLCIPRMFKEKSMVLFFYIRL